MNLRPDGYDCPEDTEPEIQLTVEEVFVNVTSYAYRPKDGEAELRCAVPEDPLREEIRILDNGKPFDPPAAAEADASRGA